MNLPYWTPSKIEELFGPIAHLLKEPYKGTKMSAEERTKLIKLAWDLIGNSLGSRHELYERFYSGDPVRTFAGQYHSYQDKKSLVDFAYQAIRREEWLRCLVFIGLYRQMEMESF